MPSITESGELHNPSGCPGLRELDKGQYWRLGLLIAPEGSGKTTALRQWARCRAADSRTHVAWLGLQPDHNRVDTFLNDLNACFGVVCPTQPIHKDRLPLEENDAELRDRIIQLINRLVYQASPFILILDNYELIESGSVHQAVKLLVEFLPPQAKMVIASTCEPPLQQARLRVRRQLVELGLSDIKNE